jgi:hypothetical protein
LDKLKTLDLLKQSVDEVPRIRTLPFHNGDFTAWRDKVLRILKSAYSEESAEYRWFLNAPGKSFIVRTETGQQEEYTRRLDCYETALKALLFEAKAFTEEKTTC